MSWWRWNREAFLQGVWLHAGPLTGDGPAATGVPRSLVEQRIVPALRAALEVPADRNVLNAALIALGETCAPRAEVLSPDGTAQRLRPFLSDRSRWIAENATLALGLSANPDSARLLARLVRGEAPAGARRPTDRGRAFAAYALGMVARRSSNPDVQRFVVDALLRGVRPGKGLPHVETACLLSLAMLAEADEDLARLCGRSPGRLIAWLAEEDLDHRLRAHVPRLLAAVASAAPSATRNEVAQALLDALRANPRHEVENGLVQALGRIAVDDERLAARMNETLVVLTRKGAPLARRLAWIALGRRAAAPFGEKAGRYLMKAAARSKAAVEPWVALALGVWADAVLRAGGPPPEEIRAIARSAMDGARSADVAAAWALCSGLARDASAAPSLGERALAAGPGTNRWLATCGLAMTRSALAIPSLRELARESDHAGETLEVAAIGLGLAGDERFAGDLLAGFEDACCATSAGAHARALARVGDARLIVPLLRVLGDDDRSERDRAWAAHTLGRLVDGASSPWTAGFSVGLNYGTLLSTLTAPDRSGLLDQG